MANLILIFVCLIIGAILHRLGKLPHSTSAVLNSFVVNIALPAIVLLHVHEMAITRRALYPAGMAWIVFIGCGIIIILLGRWLKWSRGTIGALLLTACLGNTSFVGFPLLEALYGPSSLEAGVLADQAGSFFVLSTLGLFAAAIFSSKEISAKVVARRIFTFAPFLATVVALCLRPICYPPAFISILDRIGSTLVPVALVSIGYQLNFKAATLGKYRLELGIGWCLKLIVAPLLILLIYVVFIGARGEWIQVTITEAAMAPMITGAIIAEEYGLEPELSNLMVGIGIPISLVTVPIWAHLLRWV